LKFLFDTNVISELAKAEPDRHVAEWFARLDMENCFISVITLGEIRKGVDALPLGRRRRQLAQWLERDLTAQFEGRILDVDLPTADLWGSLGASTKGPLSAIDALIAATALVHKLKLVTRNAQDFEYPGLSVINPWN
jgi:predicted nucleic acid-binding protein